MLYLDGILLHRHLDTCVFVNELHCAEAEKRIKDGETVGLLVDDELFSVLYDNKDEYREVKV